MKKIKKRRTRKEVLELTNKVKSLILFTRLTPKEIAEKIGISEIYYYKIYERIREEINSKLKDENEVVADAIRADMNVRDEALKNYLSSENEGFKRKWLMTYLDANKELVAKYLKIGVIKKVPDKLELGPATLFKDSMRNWKSEQREKTANKKKGK